MNPVALVAIVVFTPLVIGSVYQIATVGLAPFHIIGFIALLGIAGAVKRIRDDRRARYDE